MSSRSAVHRAFYKWNEEDFALVRIWEVKPGDEIAWGNGGDLKYGAIPIEEVSLPPPGETDASLFFTLPVGAIAFSKGEQWKINVFWNDDGTPLIQTIQKIAVHERVLVRRF